MILFKFILNSSLFSCLYYIFFDGMILKVKKFVIQWRKFKLKKSCIN